jgi:hypothetical protein
MDVAGVSPADVFRDAESTQCIGLVDHLLGDFKLPHAVDIRHRSGRVRVARGVGGVARIADGDELDVERVRAAAEGVGRRAIRGGKAHDGSQNCSTK